MRYQWDVQVVLQSLPLLLEGLRLTVLLAVVTMLLGSALGLVAALLRLKGRRPVAFVATAYTEFFRTTPFLVQLLWVYYALPILTGIRIPAFQSAVVAFSLNVGAFMSEIFRAGIGSVGRGQSEAALALGLTPAQAMRRVVFPQAFHNVVPPAATVWLSLFKDTSIASIIAVAEMMYEARAVAVDTYRPVELFTAAAAIYFIIVYPQSMLIDRLHEAWRGERVGGQIPVPLAMEEVAEGGDQARAG
jgi:polar amino acid transport system permease protein